MKPFVWVALTVTGGLIGITGWVIGLPGVALMWVGDFIINKAGGYE